jgi:2-iminobutanoate/2-iminopropanoate deaminase
VRGIRVIWMCAGLILSLALLAAAQESPKVERINPAGLSKPNGYSHVIAVRGGRTIYLSGQVPLTKDGRLVGAGDMEAQARQVFENIKVALASAGADMKDLVKINIYTTNVSKLDAIRKARNSYIPSDPPTSTLMEVKALFRPEVMIEVDAIAVTK